VSYPVAGQAVEGSPYREARSCLGPTFANSYYLFFLSGTSTPANVYQNGALTSAFPLVGRVPSDAYGRFPAIYLDSSVIYRVQFFNNLGVQQWQQDPYTSQLSTVGTSALSAYGFQIAATGEVTLPAPNTGGSGVTLTLSSGALGTAALQVTGTLAGNSAIIVNNSATTGTRTATFTATNKPGTATSSPAGWLPITCDGVQYYTPIWHGNNFTPYVPNPTANGEVINATSVTFTGSGLTTVTGGTATPGNWFSPTTVGIGAGYYINITKTGGLSGVNFSVAQGAWTNIGSGGLTISNNAQAGVIGTYQLSTSVSGSPIVAAGTIYLANNNGVQSPTYNGATPLVLAGNGTATLNGGTVSSWYAPTTANIGAGYYILITQTGGTSGTSFTAGTGSYTNITAGGLTIGVTGGTGTTYATGTYIIASDAGGTNQLGSGSITVSGSSVVSSSYSGTTPLNLAGNGTATLNGTAAASWYSPTTPGVGAGYYIDITPTGGTSGVNFTAAQGAWTNIGSGGLTIDISGYTGDVGTATANGTYQISNSVTGTPVLGTGTVSLSVSGLTVLHIYFSPVSGATETFPAGTSAVQIEVWGGGGGGGGGANYGVFTGGGGGGGAGGYSRSSYATSGGKTVVYTVGAAGGYGTYQTTGTSGVASSVHSGTQTVTTMTGNGGAPGHGGSSGVGGAGGAGATAVGGNQANTTGAAGGAGSSSTSAGGGGGASVVGVHDSEGGGGNGGSAGSAGQNDVGGGEVLFYYS
jgi:hypothetical protein